MKIGPFNVERELGRGAAGAVYLAWDEAGQRLLAIKIVLNGTGRLRERFRREALAAGRIEHPNVVRTLDAGEAQGRPYLVLEYVEGDSLEGVLHRGGPRSDEGAAEVVQQVALGVAAAHAVGILHRDLKPSNVLIGVDGRPRVTDFGLAKLTDVEEQEKLTRTGLYAGSPGYWSPEQAAGDWGKVGPATDVYGLGGILYACLTGEPPTQRDTLLSALQSAIAPQLAPSELRPSIDPALEAICLRCLEKDPAQRYADANEVAAALNQWRKARLTAVKVDPAPGRALAVAAALAGALGLGALGVFLASSSGSERSTGSPEEVSVREESGRTGEQDPGAPTTGGATAPKAATDEARQTAREDIREGQRRSGAGDHRGALERFDRALAALPRSLEGRRGRALARLALGDQGGALEDAEHVLADRQDATCLYVRAMIRLGRDEPQGGLEDLDAAIALGAHGPEVFVARAGLCAARREDPTSLVEEGIARFPESRDTARLLHLRAQMRFAKGDSDGALADLERGLRIAPNLLLLRVDLGALKRRLGDRAGAQEIARALAGLPDPEDRVLRLGFLRFLVTNAVEAGQWADALALFGRLIPLEPANPSHLCDRSLVKASLGDRQGALADAARACELAPRMPLAVVRRGMARLNLGDVDRAEEDAREGLWLTDPAALVDRWLLWLDVCVRRGRFAEAEAAATKVLSLAPGLAHALLQRSMSRDQLGRSEAALSDIEELLARDPTHRQARYTRAVLHHAAGRTQEALADVNALLRVEARQPHALALRAELHTVEGRLEAAQADFAAASELAKLPTALRMLVQPDQRDDAAALRAARNALDPQDTLCALLDKELAPHESWAVPEIEEVLADLARAKALTRLRDRRRIEAKALGDLGALLAADPTHPGLLAARAAYWEQAGDAAKALEDAEAAVASGPRHLGARRLRARILLGRLAPLREERDALVEAIRLEKGRVAGWTPAREQGKARLMELFEPSLVGCDDLRLLRERVTELSADQVRELEQLERDAQDWAESFWTVARTHLAIPAYLEDTPSQRDAVLDLLGVVRRLRPDDPQLGLTWVKVRVGRRPSHRARDEQALTMLDAYLARNPDTDWALAKRAWIRGAYRHPGWVQDLDRLAAQKPGSWSGWGWAIRVEVQASRGAVLEALEAMKQFFAAPPSEYSSLYRGRFKALRSRLEEQQAAQAEGSPGGDMRAKSGAARE